MSASGRVQLPSFPPLGATTMATWGDTTRELRDLGQIEFPPITSKIWWARRDSNPGPRDYEYPGRF